MLRTLVFALIVGTPSMALAEDYGREQFPEAAIGAEVRGHDGAVVGRVAAVERDADGNIIAVEVPGLAPADAPGMHPPPVVAERRDDSRATLVRARADESASMGARTRTR
ncbi:MAG: hypothetical protein R3C16_11310 [Hyphomonadaceae bacterium]